MSVEPSVESDSSRSSKPIVLEKPAHGCGLLRRGNPGNRGGGHTNENKQFLSRLTAKALGKLEARIENDTLMPSELIALVKADLSINHGDQVTLIDKPTLIKLFGLAMREADIDDERARAVGEILKRLVSEHDLALLNDVPLLFEE